MGNRATYALVEAGAVRFAYDHWGGNSAPADVLAGPVATAAYVRGLEEADGLLDTVWAEGGILLDADRRVLLVWGGEDIAWHPYLRRFYLPALRRRWPGWRVEWLVEGVADFARHLGVDVAGVLGIGRDPLPGEVAPAPTAALDAPAAPRVFPRYTLLTVRGPDGSLADHALPWSTRAAPALAWGPPLLDRLRARSPEALPPEDQADEGAYLDVPARTLWVWGRRTLDPRSLEGLRHRWPGWQVRGHVEGLVRQVMLSGRDPGAVPGLVVPPERALAELREELTRSLGYDGSVELPRIAGLIRAQDGPDAHIEINPEALGRHVPALSASARHAIVDELFGTGTGTGTGETNLADAH